VLVYNNRPGRDAELLAHYREPAWNNPVLRFLDADGRDLLPRRDGVYGAGEIAARLAGALEAAHARVPGYLALVRDELAESAWERAVLAMA
jgi:phosphoglycerate dehydrogenase-like enzyme